MVILVINAGSSSVKFTCFNMDGGQALASGLIERIGISGTSMKYSNCRGQEIKAEVGITDVKAAVKKIGECLTDPETGVLKDLSEVKAIGHRVVHGGEKISLPVILDDKAKAIIKECFAVAPLHNPPNLTGIEACEAAFPGVPNVGVFDTAFHATMPPKAFLYGLPYEFYTEDKIRRYGFHGTSHGYVAREAARLVNKPLENLKIITCHLGNGASIAAVAGGKCQDTSMGLTPLEGLIMGTRSGDLDPAIVWTLMEKKKLDHKGIDTLLNKQSGLLGLAGIGSSDLRDIEAACEKGNTQAIVAQEAYIHRIKKYVGAYMAVLGGLDVLVFTAGAGENSALVRQMVCEGLEGLGIVIDPAKNEPRSSEARIISQPESRVCITVIPTNEEKEIAEQTWRLVRK